MKIRFIKSCATVGPSYKKGQVYDLPTKEAEQFIKDKLAQKVATTNTKRKVK